MDFNQLLRESRRLESQMEGVSAGLRGQQAQNDAAATLPIQALRGPPLTRSLAQLDVAAAKLVRAQAIPPTQAADSQAQLLLAAKGIDVRKQARALKELQQAQPTRGAAAAAGPLPIESFNPLDIEGFLHQQQQLLCHSAMEDAARVTAETYRRQDLSSLDEDWEGRKRDIMDSLGFRAGKSAIAQAAGEAAMQHAQSMQSQEEAGKRRAGAMLQQYGLPAASVGPVLGMEQAIYARSVQELNRARVRRTPVPLLGMLRGAAAAVDEFFQRQSGGDIGGQSASANGLAVGDVTDCWDVLRCMLQRGDDSSEDGTPLVEKAFASAYDAPSSSPEAMRFRQQLIQGAKSYSEGLFAAYIKRVVAAHPEARRGGGAQGSRAPFARQVASYVAVLGDRLPNACRDLQLDGLPLWPQVYYCVRCGHVADALQLLQAALEQTGGGGMGGGRSGGLGGASGGGHHEQLTRTFVECMERRAQQQDGTLLPTAQWQALQEEYQRELVTAVNTARAHGASSSQAGAFVDPFKLALYHLMGRFRLPSHLLDLSTLVAPTTEDYLWLKLSLLSEGGAGIDSATVPDSLRDHVDASSLRLASLQADLLNRGEAAFNPDGRHPLAYFKVLLLSLQFEQAVYFLIKTAHFTVGVHFAVALEYAGCLHVHSNSKQELLIGVTPAGAPGSGVPATFALNYSRVLRKYVESFVRSHPFEAFHYLYLLHPQSAAARSASSARGRGGLGSSNASFSLLANAADIGMEDGIDGDSNSVSDPSFSALRDLLLETREFDLLVGSIVPAGAQNGAFARGATAAGADSIQTARGLLYNYFSASEAAALLVSTAGALAAHGLSLDAIHVYLLAYRFDLAVELALKTLAPLVSSPLQSDERQAVVAAAQRVQRVVRTQQEAGQTDRARGGNSLVGDAPAASQVALHKLLCLVNYFDHYHLGPASYDTALSVLAQDSLSLVPLQSNDAHAYAAAFLNSQQTHPAVRRTIANVAVSLMDIYWVQFQIAKRDAHAPALYQPQHAQREQLKQQRLAQLRAQAHALTSFLGLIQNSDQVGSDVYAKILATEALLSA